MSFNAATYDAFGVAYNTEYPIYIDGTTPTIPIKGSTYYPGLFGNVMCAFAVDGGDSILGGNVIVSGALSVGDNIVVGSNLNTAGLKFTLYSGYNNDNPLYSSTATTFAGAAGASTGYASDLSSLTTGTLQMLSGRTEALRFRLNGQAIFTLDQAQPGRGPSPQIRTITASFG